MISSVIPEQSTDSSHLVPVASPAAQTAPGRVIALRALGKAAPDSKDATELTPAQRTRARLETFKNALGQPKTVQDFDRQMTMAVQAVTQCPDLQQAYAQFNGMMRSMSSEDRLAFYRLAFAASPYTPGQAKLRILPFFSKFFEVRRIEGNVIPPQDKTAHQYGPGGVVTLEASGTPPNGMNVGEAVVRMAPGTRGTAPGFSFVFPGSPGQENASRVLMSPQNSYEATLRTHVFGLTTAGPEGELTFEPSDALRDLPLKDGAGKPTNAWMSRVAELPAGTVLGTLRAQDPKQDWSITVRTGDTPLTTNMMSDRSLRFPRKVRPTGIAGWIGWGAVGIVLAPVLAVRAVVGALYSRSWE